MELIWPTKALTISSLDERERLTFYVVFPIKHIYFHTFFFSIDSFAHFCEGILVALG